MILAAMVLLNAMLFLKAENLTQFWAAVALVGLTLDCVLREIKLARIRR